MTTRIVEEIKSNNKITLADLKESVLPILRDKDAIFDDYMKNTGSCVSMILRFSFSPSSVYNRFAFTLFTEDLSET